jgi:hypothetical protein
MDKMSKLIKLNANDAQFQGSEDAIRNVMQQYVDHGGRMTVADWKNLSADDKARMSGGGSTANSGAVTSSVVPAGKVPAIVKGKVVGYADDNKGTNYKAF